MGEDVPDRDPLLVVRGELRDVLADRVVQPEQVSLIEEVDQHRGHRLRRRQRAERRVGRQRDPDRIRWITGTVATHVADGAVEQHTAVAADAERERGMEAARVQPLRGPPDAISRVRLDVELARRDLRLPANAGDGVEIASDGGAGVEQHASLALYEERGREASVWRSVAQANAMPRPAEPARQNVAHPRLWPNPSRTAPRVPSQLPGRAPERLPRRLRRPRHDGRAVEQASISPLRADPRRSLGSCS